MTKHKPDVVLRSSDGKTFPTWKIFLAFSSPVFNDMFGMPREGPLQNVDETVDGLPVVDLQEDSRTLDLILALCQPLSCTGKLFEVQTTQELGAVLEATTKYDMEEPRSAALGKLADPTLLKTDPLRAYVLACRYECADAARLAAKHTLRQPTLIGEYFTELEKIHAGKLCRLLLHREQCGAVASSLATDHTWITYTDVSSFVGCGSDWSADGNGNGKDMGSTTLRHHPSRQYRSGRLEKVSVHKWWIDYMKKSKDALEKTPCGSAVQDPNLVGDAMAAIASSKCKECKTSEVRVEFRSFVNSFAEKIEQTVTELNMDLGF